MTRFQPLDSLGPVKQRRSGEPDVGHKMDIKQTRGEMQNKRNTKKYAAFLSFAYPDKDLVDYLRSLFQQLNKQVFYSPQSLQESLKAKPKGWRRKIIDAVRDSACFVPIYTRHSLRREWVLYESGVADAFRKQRFPARSASVSPTEIEDLPGPGDFVYDLSDKDQLAQLITNVCEQDGDDRGTVQPKVFNVVHNSPLAEAVCKLARTRWVFVAGNYPDNAAQPSSGINWFTNRADYLERLKRFCEMLTESLLEGGFSVCACPQVDSVGMHVTAKAVAYLDDTDHPPHVDFAIGGIYPIDRDARNRALSETARRKWHNHIMEFRKSYLSKQEWLVLIGGNEGTREEHDAAKKAKVKVIAIPCFGGMAASLHAKTTDSGREPCGRCTKRNGLCDAKEIRQIVTTLGSCG